MDIGDAQQEIGGSEMWNSTEIRGWGDWSEKLEWRRGGRGLSATVSALSLFTSGEPLVSGNSQPMVKIR